MGRIEGLSGASGGSWPIANGRSGRGASGSSWIGPGLTRGAEPRTEPRRPRWYWQAPCRPTPRSVSPRTRSRADRLGFPGRPLVIVRSTPRGADGFDPRWAASSTGTQSDKARRAAPGQEDAASRWKQEAQRNRPPISARSAAVKAWVPSLPPRSAVRVAGSFRSDRLRNRKSGTVPIPSLGGRARSRRFRVDVL
jgi:hypothetical protein